MLLELHWLPVVYRIKFKVLLQVYKALNGEAPQYVADMLIKRTQRGTRSTSVTGPILTVPVTKLATYGDRSFSAVAPRLWNDLPLDIRESRTTLVFKTKLKTCLFKQAYSDVLG